MLQNHENLRKYEYEIISSENPIIINLSNTTRIVGCEIEQFYYTSLVVAPPQLIGIVVEGTRGRFNQNGQQTEVVKTIPASGNTYNFNVSDDDIIQLNNSGTSFKIGFIDRTKTGLNPTFVPFNNNYLLVLNIYTA